MKALQIFAVLLLLCGSAYAQEKTFYGDCKNGFGVKVTADKTSILGYFQNGQLNGYALVAMPNGDMYAGFLKDNVCWGKGTFFYGTKGVIYIGDYEKNVQQGVGTIFVPSIQILDGTFSNNQPVQVSKIDTKNTNSPCLLGDCEKGPGSSFESAQSFSCIGKDMVLICKPNGYVYFGPKSSEGYMSILTKEYIYVGKGKDREPFGEGGKFYSKTGKVDFGNWGSVRFNNETIPMFCDINKSFPAQINQVNQFKIPADQEIWNCRYSSSGGKILVTLMDESLCVYDIDKKSFSKVSGDDKVVETAISSDGKFCAYSSSNNDVKVIDLATNKPFKSMKDSVISYKLDFTPDSKYIVYSINSTKNGGLAEKTKVVDYKTGKIVKEFFSNDMLLLSFVGYNGFVKVNDKDYKYDCSDKFYLTKNNQFFLNRSDSIVVFNYLSGKKLKYSIDSLKGKTSMGKNAMRFVVSQSGNRIAIISELGINILDVKQGIWTNSAWLFETKKYQGIKTYNKTVMGVKMPEYGYATDIRWASFSPDENSLILSTRKEFMVFKLNTNDPNQPGYNKQISKESITISNPGFEDTYISSDGSRIYHRADDNTITIYEVKYN